MHSSGRRTAERGPPRALTHEDILRELDAAVSEHLDWMTRWHRSALCKVEPPVEIVSEQAHFLCSFGSWCDLHQLDPLVAQPAFAALYETHRELHQHAGWLAKRAWKDPKLPTQEYDALMEKVNRFIDQSRRLQKAFRKVVSDLDPLTGAHTRQDMMKDLMRERERAARGKTSCIVAMADLDRFKEVNDTHGHQAGDMVLRTVADAFLGILRPYDRLYRYGGEEFLVCLPDCTMETARTILDRLRVQIAALSIDIGGGRMLQVTCSFGMTPLSADAPLKTVIERADRALYAAKQAGRDRVLAWTAEMR
ncbi:MAG: diguanylate cyclase [Alphaproteobacteria bacterium]|nr:diguanylate cyclase [Alphaproteobacteria bacterium]MBU0797210.1 diguanylate cyclase [Alphaproteobacteria bacterium]MBU0889002.1 diguanylate cyclase [Alphaproteobacteria bacterium]MBU1814022.1 diguanylate cyclase [Alphaproteobacteria bacterium]MBU2090112.1 diguanylate cyclase [Alphaproteobacteria bacterium]